MDGNPQNPLNWELLSPIYQGQDVGSRHEWVQIGGVNTIVGATYTRDWSTMIWFRNGVSLGSGVDLPYPFSTGVDGDTVDMTSNGSVTLRIHWKSTAPVPPRVRVSILSVAEAGGKLLGVRTVDNGIGSPIVDEDNGFVENRQQSGKVIRTLDVDGSGVAQYTLTKSAHGTGVPSWSYRYPACWAAARGGYMAVDIRTAIINMSGVGTHYERTMGANVAQAIQYDDLGSASWNRSLAIINSAGAFRQDIYVHQTHNYTYPSASATESELVYDAGVSNSATWHFGFPVPTQTWSEGYTYNTLYPAVLDPFHIVMIGAAVSLGQPVESYSWSGFDGGLSGDLPDNDGYYVIPDYVSPDYIPDCHLVHRKFFDPVDPQKLTYSDTTDFTSPNATGGPTINLTYTWPDGAVATSRRTLVYHPHIETHLQSDHAQVDWQKDAAFRSMPFEDGSAWKRAPFTGNAKVTDEGDYQLLGYLKTATGVVGGVIDIAAAFVDLPAGIEMAAATAGAIDAVFELFGGYPEQENLSVSSDNNFPLVYEYDGGLHPNMKGSTSDADYDFQEKVRPRLKITPLYVDTWNASGFDKRSPNLRKGREMQRSSPRIIWFKYVGGTFGGGGGTGGSGAGGANGPPGGG